jgi:hypothetical protein
MHVDVSVIYPSALVFYTRHQVNITIYRTVYLHTDMCLQTLTHIQLKNKLNYTLLCCCNLIWGLANNNYSLYILQFLIISGNLRLCYLFIPYCTVLLYIVVPLNKLTSFFCWRSHKYELQYYNLCGIGSQHSNISKGKGVGGTYKHHWYARLQ